MASRVTDGQAKEEQVGNKRDWEYTFETDHYRVNAGEGGRDDVYEFLDYDSIPDGMYPAPMPVFGVDRETGEIVTDGREDVDSEDVVAIVASLFELDISVPAPRSSEGGRLYYELHESDEILRDALNEAKERGVRYVKSVIIWGTTENGESNVLVAVRGAQYDLPGEERWSYTFGTGFGDRARKGKPHMYCQLAQEWVPDGMRTVPTPVFGADKSTLRVVLGAATANTVIRTVEPLRLSIEVPRPSFDVIDPPYYTPDQRKDIVSRALCAAMDEGFRYVYSVAIVGIEIGDEYGISVTVRGATGVHSEKEKAANPAEEMEPIETKEELFFENETRKHQQQVARYLISFAKLILDRAATHDKSKLEAPERAAFIKATGKLRGLTYGSDEYKEQLKELGEALQHHYARNPHHPEYFEANGFHFEVLNDPIRAMHMVDVVEMACDWIAATERHDDGDIGESLRVNKERFGLDPQLVQLIANTSSILRRMNFSDPGSVEWRR